MLRRLNELEGYAIEASDGTVGQVTDFLFDDEAWVVRYLVVYTGSWLSNRTVLISPIAIGKAARSDRTLRVPMTMEQVRNSPDVDTKKPVSRQQELGAGVEPHTVAADRARVAREVEQHRDDDPHLRSANAVMRYHINASDGGIGHVQGLLLDEDTWAIRYLIVDTSNWWLGHKVLITPQWIQGVSWSERTVSIDLTREAIKNSPPYDSASTLHRHQEASLYDHYHRDAYWADHVRLQNPEFRSVGPAPQDVIDRHA
jgi:sporulation protein YlmC with PRC-barrel domain